MVSFERGDIDVRPSPAKSTLVFPMFEGMYFANFLVAMAVFCYMTGLQGLASL